MGEERRLAGPDTAVRKLIFRNERVDCAVSRNVGDAVWTEPASCAMLKDQVEGLVFEQTLNLALAFLDETGAELAVPIKNQVTVLDRDACRGDLIGLNLREAACNTTVEGFLQKKFDQMIIHVESSSLLHCRAIAF